MSNLRLISIVCNRTEDSVGDDEIYLLVKGNKVWGPENMDTSPADKKTKDLTGLELISFTQKARLDLYDEDTGWLDDDDHLGTNYVYEGELNQGDKECSFTNDGASYTLTYQVIP